MCREDMAPQDSISSLHRGTATRASRTPRVLALEFEDIRVPQGQSFRLFLRYNSLASREVRSHTSPVDARATLTRPKAVWPLARLSDSHNTSHDDRPQRIEHTNIDLGHGHDVDEQDAIAVSTNMARVMSSY